MTPIVVKRVIADTVMTIVDKARPVLMGLFLRFSIPMDMALKTRLPLSMSDE